MPSKRVLIGIGVALGVAFVGVLAFVDPASSAFFPRCLFHLVTGLHCPGCGLQRAVHALLSGRLVDALGYNALAVTMLPLTLVAVAAERMAPLRMRAFWDRFPPWSAVVVACIVVAFTIVRNLPLPPFAWLAP